jgi:hypothetical protein
VVRQQPLTEGPQPGGACGSAPLLKSGLRESNPHHQLGRLRFYH